MLCDDVEYLIGHCVRASAERVVHELTNCHTGLTLHQINIPRDRPNAVTISTRRAEKLAELRELGIGDTLEPLVVRAHGGCFEMDEVWTFEEGRASALFEQALRAAHEENWAECRALSEQVLAESPTHTPALDLLACSYGETGDFLSAVRHCLVAIKYEPNIRSVRHNLLRYTAAAGHIVLFTREFDDLKHKWPTDDQEDGLAAEVYLAAGRPDKAAGLRVPAGDAELDERVHEELRRREQARALMRSAFDEVYRGEDRKAFRSLKQAYAEYDKDVEIAFNWGHLLLRRGDWRDVPQVLGGIIHHVPDAVRTQCLGSIAFALAVGGEYRAAAEHLMMVWEWLTSISEDTPPVVFDLPLWASWLEDDRVLAERSLRQPFLLLDRTINGLRQSGSEIPDWLPALRHLRDLYERGLPQG